MNGKCKFLGSFLAGYLNEGGKLNLPRFEKYLAKLAQVRTLQLFNYLLI